MVMFRGYADQILQIRKSLIRVHHNSENETYKNVLIQIDRFLAQSKKSDDDALRLTLSYIAALPTGKTIVDRFYSNFFSNEDEGQYALGGELRKNLGLNMVFDDYLYQKAQNEPSTFKPDPNQTPLASHHQEFLEKLYMNLRQIYNGPAWVYNYSEDVFTDAMSEGWNISANQAVGDMTRNTEVEGVSGINEVITEKEMSEDQAKVEPDPNKEITSEIKQIATNKIKEAHAKKRVQDLVTKASSYPEESRDMLIQWLLNNGGQAMTGTLLNPLFIQDHFGTEPGYAAENKLNWVEQDGKIVLLFDSAISYVIYKDGTYLVATNEGARKINDTNAFEAARIDYDGLKKDKKPLPKLMSFTGKIALEVDGSNVLPRVTECRVESYAAGLLSPARLFSYSARAVSEKMVPERTYSRPGTPRRE